MFAQESVMDIKKEREAFLNVYVNYKGDSRKIQFNEETEQFMCRKNNVTDTEVEYVHLMNQRWYAWLACAKSKAQAVPEGFVLVEKAKLMQIIGSVSLIEPITRGNPYMDSVKRELTAITDVVKTVIEAQGQK